MLFPLDGMLVHCGLSSGIYVLDCLQSPIFHCDCTLLQTAAILASNGEHNLRRVPNLPRGQGVGLRSERWEK